MRRLVALWVGLCGLAVARAAELRLDFAESQVGQCPPGFRSLVAGEGKPGDWRVVLDEVPPLLAPLSGKAPVVTRRPVLAQLAEDPTDEHFPILVYDGQSFGDFSFTTRFKTVKGQKEQMAGVVFRLQDERNFYVVRASSLGGTFRFYKVVEGQRSPPVGPQVAIPSGQWHELTVECRGNQIRCLLDGREIIPALADSSFARGKIGFWTKSDSVSYFAEPRIVYKPAEPPAQGLVRDMLERYPRVRDIKVFARRKGGEAALVVGAKQADDLGKPAGSTEARVLAEGRPYYVRSKREVVVVLPLHDRNGETIAAVRVTLGALLGQTEQNALTRALPVARAMQARVTTLEDLVE